MLTKLISYLAITNAKHFMIIRLDNGGYTPEIQGVSERVHFSKRQWQYQDVTKFDRTRAKIIQKGLPFYVRS